jgi:hypothetical protein
VGLPGGRWYHWISSSILLNKLNWKVLIGFWINVQLIVTVF